MLSGVVIAGGRSSRMGEDKALMPFGSYSSLAQLQYRKLQKIFNRVYISTKSNKFDFDANLIYDKYNNISPLNAIISSLEETNSDIFLLSVDIPLISKKTIDKLIDAYKKYPYYETIIAKSINGLEPTVAIYKQSVLNVAKQMQERQNFKLREFIKSTNYLTIPINSREEFLNINTKKDYKEAINLINF